MNNPIYSYICQPVGIGTKVIQLPLYRPLNTKELSKDLVLYLRGQGYRVYSTYSPNVSYPALNGTPKIILQK
ncbi:hypothetical protein [Sulfurisphaera ohwakuensis]|uniref:Uncharacterized protein n=1 Tax=Sulfurisphaera ohwakuensis TaxID=69656 RepID=A0A650CJS1_SULOH|nr:hypothetical protein [Sulfurisphaera ohwakuensis]MBB5255099.1 hypothetical protein [Sulfurisphaera ohwakuensis]QGR18090.1 hypothetical protein D1869_13500 [Sulfurisphaera ohwakuensis]